MLLLLHMLLSGTLHFNSAMFCWIWLQCLIIIWITSTRFHTMLTLYILHPTYNTGHVLLDTCQKVNKASTEEANNPHCNAWTLEPGGRMAHGRWVHGGPTLLEGALTPNIYECLWICTVFSVEVEIWLDPKCLLGKWDNHHSGANGVFWRCLKITVF